MDGVPDPLDDFRALNDPPRRREVERRGGYFVVEGLHAIGELLTSPYRVRTILASDRMADRVRALVDGRAPVTVRNEPEVAAVAGFPFHRGALASADRRPLPDPDDLLVDRRFVAVVEGVGDHENLGALFRNAAAFGVDAVLLDPTTADPLYRRSVRVSLGHVLHVPWTRTAPLPGGLHAVRARGFEIVALDPGARRRADRRPGRPPAARAGRAAGRSRGSRPDRGDAWRPPTGGRASARAGRRLAQRRHRGRRRLPPPGPADRLIGRRARHHGGMAATHEETHEVTNQPPPLEGYDVFAADAALVEAVEREGAGWAADDLHALGRLAGSPEAIAWGFEANRHEPELRTHDRYGHRIDAVAYHPAYHELMQVAVGHGLHGAPWAVDQPGTHVARAAGFVVWSQVDAGHGCPVSMTYSVVPALRSRPDLAAEWEPRLTARAYDPRDVPAREKPGALAGMGMTEKQGGSDVRANTTRAEPGAGGEAGEWLLTGHKWFCSAPMSDLFLMLAQAPGGLSCFLVPRWLPDGTRNAGFRLQRLKDKLGNRSNASSEVELDGAVAWLVGEEGRGVRTIIDMVAHTRLDCVLGATATMRQATAQALHHAAHRRAFGRCWSTSR